MFWKIPLSVAGFAVGAVVLLLIAATCVLYIPSLRAKVIDKGLAFARKQTGLDIGIGDFGLRLSPVGVYRAYKGKEDLPLELSIDSLFVGHRGQDTLVYARALRLNAVARTAGRQNLIADGQLLSIPIDVEQLLLDETAFHSGTMIQTVGVDAEVGHLSLNGPGLNIAQGYYPLHDLRLYDVFCGIDLRPSPEEPSPEPKDTTSLRLAFDIPNGDLRNIHFALTPTDLDLTLRTLRTNALVDVGANRYDARRIDIGGVAFRIGDFALPVDTLHGDADVELGTNLITSNGLYVRSDAFGAQVDLAAATMDLAKMRVEVNGLAEYRGTQAQVDGYYAINDEAYGLHADIMQVDLSPFLKDSSRIVLAGQIDAEGKGFDPNSQAMRSKLNLSLTDAIYESINLSGLQLNAALANKAVEGSLHLPVHMTTPDRMDVKAQTEHRFRVADFMKPEQMKVDYQTQLSDVQLQLGDGQRFEAQQIDLCFATDSATSLDVATEGLTAAVSSPMHVLRLVDGIQALTNYPLPVTDNQSPLTHLHYLDTIRHLIPDMKVRVDLAHGSPLQSLIESKGLDIRRVGIVLSSDNAQTDLTVEAAIPEITHPEDSTALRLPAANAALQVKMREGTTFASLSAGSKLTDGVMSLHDFRTDADLWFDLTRKGNDLRGEGFLTLDDIALSGMELGSRSIELALTPSDAYANALRADVQVEDIPLQIVEGILQMADLELNGAVRAQATVDGLPGHVDLSAEVLPLGVSAKYKPYDIRIGLGETPVVMKHNKVDFNGLPVYGADSTFIAFTGGLDLNEMRLNITLEADSFAPVKLVKDGPIPVYGELATDILGSVTGPLDSIKADVDVTILPTTDITYPIDKKNLAQVKPHGTVNVRYESADNNVLLGGRVNVDDGFIRYSPKAYPIMPFHVDSGSHVSFNGPVGQTMLNVSASQRVKADVESEDEETRRVDFRTGVRVNGVVDSIGLHSIGFFLEAPEDETITQELASLDEETREGLAATLLATGMYVGESNVAAQRGGYALSSIINSRLNAAMANSKVGKLVDIDLSSAQTEHAGGNTNDFNIAISKSFFKDRLRITVGSSFTDDPEINKASGLLNNLSAEYKLTKQGNVSLRAFAQRDYNNILEGELYKSGLGVRAKQEWRRQELFRGDSLVRTYGLMADADIAWRSNNSLGPNLTLTSSIKNVLGKGETFTIKGNGAYYWALRNRHPGDPKKTDTYKLGVNASLVFPYLHWLGDNKPEGDTRYMVGYQYENIAGGYGVHKLSGSFTYFIRTSRFVTHAFTPFSLSIVLMNTASDSLINKAAEFPQLIKLIAGNEFVPAVGYNFTYNDYRSKRTVNTMFDIGVKEAGNLINALYCAFGRKWNDKNKPLGSITYNQFVKITTELRNKFNITDRVCIATRLFAGANIPLGNSDDSPLSEAFYAGGPNGMRAASPYAYGPGNFYSDKFNQNFFHAGDIKLEANFELRFPIVWKLCGATFLDAGNVWTWYNGADIFKKAGVTDYMNTLQLRSELYDGIIDNPEFLRQIALGTGAGLRLDLDGLVIRLDLGVAIHAPYQTYRYDKEWKVDKTKPITSYFNIPSALDALRVNFGIGYPF